LSGIFVTDGKNKKKKKKQKKTSAKHIRIRLMRKQIFGRREEIDVWSVEEKISSYLRWSFIEQNKQCLKNKI